MKKGILHLIPTPLGEDSLKTWLSPWLTETLNGIRHFIAEDQKQCRRFLRNAGFIASFDDVSIGLLNEHTSPEDFPNLIKPCIDGFNMALMSDAGCPGIADPGSEVIRIAHEKNIRVIPVPGPSSILMAMMSSGLNGQQFTFHGYLPRERKERTQAIKQAEQNAITKRYSQIVMDTPYRNAHVLEDLLSTCRESTLLCVAVNVNCINESIRTMTIGQWKKNIPDLSKQPCIFILGI